MKQTANIFRRTAQMFESGEYTGHYACDALGVIPGAVSPNGHNAPGLSAKTFKEWLRLRDAYAGMFEPDGIEPKRDAIGAWWENRDERILSLYFAAALAEKGDL